MNSFHSGKQLYSAWMCLGTATCIELYEELLMQLVAAAPEDIDLYIDGPFLDPSGADARLMTIEHDGKDLIIKVAEV